MASETHLLVVLTSDQCMMCHTLETRTAEGEAAPSSESASSDGRVKPGGSAPTMGQVVRARDHSLLKTRHL